MHTVNLFTNKLASRLTLMLACIDNYKPTPTHKLLMYVQAVSLAMSYMVFRLRMITHSHSYACSTHVGHVHFVYFRVYSAVSAHSLVLRWRECDCKWCPCDSSNNLLIIMTVVEHLACKSKPSMKKGIPCPNQDTTSHWECVYVVNS